MKKLMRDDTEHGKEYYLASEVDALLSKQEQGEPLEYWNAVEGWVRIDEVREHFDSVGCATIYKNGGEDRVPLRLAQQRPWIGLTNDEIDECAHNNMRLGEFRFRGFYNDIATQLKERNQHD